ncbi:zf-PARP-domain-containing protein, partial [Bimuria novae-zelandiae CBS 107.79]
NSRAGCTNSECNKAKVKIQKGELRFATQITVQEHTSWKYRHWGCVTPEVIQNWKEENEGDPELIDGYDELSAESKEKVDYALKNGHVHDDDWKGVSAVNKPRNHAS